MLDLGADDGCREQAKPCLETGCEYMLTHVSKRGTIKLEQWVCTDNNGIGSYDLRLGPLLSPYECDVISHIVYRW
ncbi:hypothetical protein AG1IA_08092 [Rhizoctonia solani AG-1 IA]|uniref:Uncharacterized protein n=1 Tax=Thanatephorus cucumeris (strain AG1-IA) TaxID=983506 RepID=L8WIY8_THACA|nr:hypothetical protein AG1IA_08092 [Rhizoctonia solani AG-1 IA]